MSRPFRFRRFEVQQQLAAMKVGTDGVLLGAWAPIPATSAPLIADVGAGTGVIALMMAQRCPGARIIAVELDPPSAFEAGENAKASPWSDRITVECEDFADFAPAHPLDLIISNPPFFTEELRSPDVRRAGARHAAALSPAALIARAPAMLSPAGTLAFIAPAASDDDIEWLAALHRMCVTRRTAVAPHPAADPIRTLWAMSPMESPCTTDRLDLRVSKGGEYSAAYLDLVHNFYLWIK